MIDAAPAAGLGRRGFFWRLFLSYTGLVLLSAVVIGALVLANLRRNAVSELTSHLLVVARLLAATESTNPAHLWSEQLAEQVTAMADETGLCLTLLLSSGRIVAEAGAATDPLEDVLQAPEIIAARRTGSGFADRSLSLGAESADHVLVAVPILFEHEIIGYVRVGSPVMRLRKRQVQLRNQVIIGAGLSSLAALGLGLIFTRSVTRPLERIAAACRRVAAGKLEETIAEPRRDEIGVVASTIERMTAELRRRIAEESRERQRMTVLLAAMQDGVIAITARHTIGYLNAVAARLLALDPEACMEQDFRAIVRFQVLIEIYDAAVRENARVSREVRITGHPQDQVWSVSATVLRSPANEAFGVLIVLHDLTGIRRLEQVRQTFSANVSHELKTPLTAIGSLVDALLDDAEMNAATRARFLAKIRDQNERLYRLVQDLLTISRIESEHEVLEMRDVSLTCILSPCLRTFAPVAAQKQIALVCDAPEEPDIRVRANAEAGRLIVNNLLQNAIQHTSPGGRVDVSIRSTNDTVAIEVKDTGIGIAAEHLDRIFERFYRVDRSRARRDGGAGLGLAIVKHLSSAMGGRVIVESTPGVGSTFTVFLRAAASAAHADVAMAKSR
ncbi:MAG: ATP-binding protein [Opitutaceae bacterium]